jgi:hypothetical protein
MIKTSSIARAAFLCAIFMSFAAEGHPETRGRRTLVVPDDFREVQEAIDSASAGDTVLLKEGVFDIAKSIDLKEGVSLVGSGADKTILNGTAALRGTKDPEKGSIVIARDRTAVKNLCIRGSDMCGIYVRGVAGEVQMAAVERTVIADCSVGIYLNNQFNASGILRCTNNTIARCGIGVSDNDWKAVAMENNLIANCQVGVKKFNVADWVAEYNDVFGCSAANWDGMTPSASNLSKDPRFADASAGDFSLRALSPCIDAGNPDAAFNDPDGTRADIGALVYSGRRD